MLATLVILVLVSIALSVYNTVQLRGTKKDVTTQLNTISSSLAVARLGYVRGEAKKISAYGSTGKRERVGEDGDEVLLSGEEFKFPGKDTPGFTNGANSKLRVDPSRWVGVPAQTDESDLDPSV